MIELLSLGCGVICIIVLAVIWRHQKRLQYHAMNHYTKEFVSAVEAVFADDDVATETKEFFKVIAPYIDNRRLARFLAKSIAERRKYESSSKLLDGVLDDEQKAKIVKAIMLFVVALSYSDPARGWILRDFILSSEMDKRAAEARFVMSSSDYFGGDHLAQPA